MTASVDGRVTLNRASPLLDDAAGNIWDSIHPGSADAMVAARRAEIERRYAPQVVLEGSGTFAADADGPVTGLPPPGGDIAALYKDFLPGRADCRWFAVVDGRGRISWAAKEDAGKRLLIIVSHATPAAYLAHLRSEGVPYLVAGDGPVDLGGALRTMKDQQSSACLRRLTARLPRGTTGTVWLARAVRLRERPGDHQQHRQGDLVPRPERNRPSITLARGMGVA